jgi:glycosyltransferase involved in cell wall biosynthesis
MHVLIIGGSSDHRGGLEAFSERSAQALTARNPDWRIAHAPTNTAYLTARRLPGLARGLAGLIDYRRSRPDVVWLQYVNLPDLLYLALSKVLRMRIMVTPHLGANWRSQSRPGLRRLSNWLLGFADRLALISTTQELEIALPAHVPRSLIRNFLPAEVLEAGAAVPLKPRPAALQLMHSGRLSEGKGTFLVVEVCARLKALQIPFRARITGAADTVTAKRLQEMITKHELEELVTVHGRVTDAELLRLLSESDILLHLSRIDSYPLIVLEAMTCSMLPVCIDLAGARDMIEQYDGRAVEEAAAVDQTVEFLATTKLADIRRRASAQASRVCADYSWRRCAAALEDALNACAVSKETQGNQENK